MDAPDNIFNSDSRVASRSLSPRATGSLAAQTCGLVPLIDEADEADTKPHP